ncbi:MAG: leucine-rich repeat domain-containing protein [Lachnospiraceae bacterium]|nr:leucine-rich repeat domain-containing protein [Lachnospiraceae bacterium]
MRKQVFKILSFCLAFILVTGMLSDCEGAFAFQDKYYGEEKVKSYEALSEFTEEGVNYLVTKRPAGGSYGEVYVAGCDFRLETLTIPGVVKHSGKYNVIGINDMAFENFENLTKVTIEDGLTYIGGGAFWGCWYLESIQLPKTLKELGEDAFGYCGSLKSITFPDAITEIPRNVCEYSGISKITFGKKVTGIGDGAFRHCYSLKEVTLPASLKTLGNGVFGECRNLGGITNNSKLKKADYEQAFGATKWERDQKTGSSSFVCADKDIIISVFLDDKQLTKGYLYYRMDDYTSDADGFKYDDWEHGVNALLSKDKDGNFILDRQYISQYMFPIQGELYYCELKSKDYLKDYTLVFKTSDIPSTSNLGQDMYDADTAEAERIKADEGEEAYNEFISGRKSAWEYTKELDDTVRPVRLYTVKYEQGKDETCFLPQDTVISRHGYHTIGSGVDMVLSGLGRIQNPVAAAKALAYYADSKGNRIDSIKDITHSVTLHPVFVDEDRLFTGENYLAENDWYYTSYMRCDSDWSKIAENINIKKGAELISRLLTETNEKDGICVINGKVTLSCSDLEKYLSGKAKDARERDYIKPEMEGYFYNREDFILVRSGGTLVLDGVRLQNAVKISLQKGAKLELINGTEIKDGVLALQEGAEAELKDAGVSCVILNAGRITVKTPKSKTATDSFYQRSIRSNIFLNCKTGVIDLDYGTLSWGNDFDIDFGPGALKTDMRDEKDAVVINNGTVNVTGYGHISMEDGSQNREHKESFAKTPIVNNGTINITSDSKRFYEFAAIEIDHNSFYNYGKIKVTSDVRRKTFADSYAAESAEWENSFYAEIHVQEAEFINYGTIDLNIKNGTGISVVESFFPRDRVVKRFEKDGDTSSHGRLENRKGGKINVVTDNGCGIVIGRNAYLINDGTVTIKEKDDNSREPSILIGGKLINNSKVNNNGSIGYTAACMQKAYAPDNGYSGKKWKGKGKELLAYVLDLRGPDGYNEYNVYVNSGKRVLVDGTAYIGDGQYTTVFLPVNTKVKLTVKVNGFADKTVEYTTAGSVKKYLDAAYKRLKSGSSPDDYIRVSLSRKKN